MTGERERLDGVADWYDGREDFDRHLIAHGARLIVGRARGTSVLEVGCGVGVMTEVFVGAFARVEGVDGSSRNIEATRAAVGDRARLHVSLFEDFSPERPAGEVVLASVLEHVVDPVGLLRSASGWMAEGGSLHVIVPNAGALNRRVGRAMGMLARLDELHARDHRLGHRRVYDRDHLEADIDAAGLAVAERSGIFLKPLSNAQMAGWPPELIAALFAVGDELPDLCSQLYARCVRR